VILHNLFGNHLADPQGNHWVDGLFVSTCEICGRAMVKPPGEKWKLQAKKVAA
jgi:hypothetical protein